MRDTLWSWHQLFDASAPSHSGRGYEIALRGLSPEELDTVSEQLIASPWLLAQGFEDFPQVVKTWSHLRPEAFATGLLRLGADLLGGSLDSEQNTARSALLKWRRMTLEEDLAPGVEVARAFADFLHEEDRRRVRSGGPTAGLTLLFDLVAHYSHYGSQLDVTGHRRRLRDHVVADPEQWAAALPWLLQVAGTSDVVTVGTLWAVQTGSDAIAVLRSAADSSIEPMATRALGLTELLEGDPDAEMLLARVARRMDRGRARFPRSLAEPTSTWLSDLGLEQELRSAVERATIKFADEFKTQGPAEEEGHVASLLTRIESELGHAEEARAVDGFDALSAEVTGSYRRLPKSEEASVHADIALTIEIDVVGRLDTIFTELVQVKKANRLDAEPGADSWRIKVEQLTQLLGISPTSVYWLLCADGTVLVVPAKMPLAVARGRHVDHQGTFTLYYSEVRHAAIDLPSYLVDLSVGGWLGSTARDAVELGEGTAGTSSARALLRLRLRTVQG